MDGRNTRRTVYRGVRGSDAMVRNAMSINDIETVFLLDADEAEEIAAEKEEIREGSDEEELFKAGYRD